MEAKGLAAASDRGWNFDRTVIVAAFSAFLATGIVVGILMEALLFTFLIFLLPPLVLTLFLIWKGRARSYLAAGIGLLYPIVLLYILLGGAYETLQNPQRGTEFITLIAVTAAAAIGFPLGVMAYRKRKRGEPLPGFRSGLSSLRGMYVLAVLFTAVGAMVTGSLAFSAVSEAGFGGGYDFQPDVSVTIRAANFQFVPDQVSVQAGVITEIVVINEDSSFHTFTYELNGKLYDHELNAGTTTSFLVLLPSAGTVHFWCVPHSPDMAGDFVIS